MYTIIYLTSPSRHKDLSSKGPLRGERFLRGGIPCAPLRSHRGPRGSPAQRPYPRIADIVEASPGPFSAVSSVAVASSYGILARDRSTDPCASTPTRACSFPSRNGGKSARRSRDRLRSEAT